MLNRFKSQILSLLTLLSAATATALTPADSTDAALDSLLLSIEGMELDEIVVVSRRNIVESDGALTVGCFAGNIFNRYQTYRETVRSNDMVLRSAWKNQHSNFGISLTWKFGNLKSDMKSTGASVDNNDSAAGSGESRGR